MSNMINSSLYRSSQPEVRTTLLYVELMLLQTGKNMATENNFYLD
jgi:hypothetical protein